jgi:hypothetical protein
MTMLRETGDYFLGIGVTRPSGELRSQLNLADEQGLVVESVIPGGPADKGGLKPFDVLMKAGDKPLKGLRDLSAEIENVKEGKMAIELLRGGKTQTLSVTPEKRSSEGPAKIIVRTGPGDDEGNALWLENPLLREGQGGDLFFLHPGQILPPGAPLPPSTAKDVHVTIRTEATLPDGYKVEIVRADKDPAKITVSRGKEKWETTEGKLDKLPEKIRPEVQRLARGMFFLATFGTSAGGPADIIGPNVTVRSLPSDAQILQRLEEVTRQMEDLSKRLKKLEPAPSPGAPPPAQKPEK